MESHQLNSVETTEKYLTDNGIAFKTVRHTVTMTNAEMIDTVKFDGDYEGTVLAKQLFLYDRKKKENMWLVCAAVDTDIDLKALNKHLPCASGSLRAADHESLEKFLGCRQGMCNYFAMVNDKEKNVKIILDQKLMEAKFASFHPMDNTGSTAINKEGIEKLRELAGRDETNFEFMDFAKLAADAGGAPAGGEAKQKPQKQEKKGPKVEQGKKMTAEEKKAANDARKAEKDAKKAAAPKGDDKNKEHELSILYKKGDNFSKWYTEVIVKSDMIDYYDISGCYVLRPRAYYIWEKIQNFMDARFVKKGVQNAYFPMFVSKAALEKEKEHVEGFSPEVAWVTRSGQSELDIPIAIRPTSETIMYPLFSKWINSHRDLPLKINQWSNVVRWEFKHPTPFIRTREFLWQEGHTAHVSEEDASTFVRGILDVYADTYEHLLAVPCCKGRKSKDETFPGAFFSETTEIYVPQSGRGIQGATSHQLGTNFGKMFDVTFLDKNKEKQLCWQTSWGLSTRSIGAMIMVHSDDKGLVLPPKAAIQQVVIIPIEKAGQDNKAILEFAETLFEKIKASGIRVHLDDTDTHNPGWKYNYWEQRGVPIRLEVGAKDLEKTETRCCKRNDGVKQQLKVDDTIAEEIQKILDQIHDEMFAKALANRNENITSCDNWADFMTAINARKQIMAPWCDVQQCEIDCKERSKNDSMAAMEAANEAGNDEEALLTGAAKTLCIPNEQTPLKEGQKCFACDKPATVTALWGRSY